VCCALAALGCGIVLAGLPGRWFAGFVVLLVLPGYAVLRALDPAGKRPVAEVALFVLTFSTAAAILGGLALNFTPWGLERTSWALWALIVTLTASGVAAARGAALPAWRAGGNRWPRSWRARTVVVAMAVMAVTVTAAALAVAQTPVANRTVRGYTLLSVVPSRDNSRVLIRVVNEELDPTTYELRARANGRTIYSWRGIRLDPSAAWAITIDRNRGGFDSLLAFLLYRADSPKVYRHVFIQPYCPNDGAGRLACPTGAARTLAPTAPSNLRLAARRCGTQTLNWTRARDDLGLSNYVVWMRSRRNYRWQVVGRPTRASLTLHSTSGAFDWRLKARNIAGNLSPFARLVGARIQC
jgi:uncharacterized membrane protein